MLLVFFLLFFLVLMFFFVCLFLFLVVLLFLLLLLLFLLLVAVVVGMYSSVFMVMRVHPIFAARQRERKKNCVNFTSFLQVPFPLCAFCQTMKLSMMM